MKHESAFPWSVDDGQKITGNKGMTLRDYFAAKAMQAFLTREEKFSSDLMLYAGAAYDVADAMLEARQA